MPWQQHFALTKIDEQADERWFCDADETERAGWPWPRGS
jgi:hypothetical protein